jgi:hypothetical protein
VIPGHHQRDEETDPKENQKCAVKIRGERERFAYGIEELDDDPSTRQIGQRPLDDLPFPEPCKERGHSRPPYGGSVTRVKIRRSGMRIKELEDVRWGEMGRYP